MVTTWAITCYSLLINEYNYWGYNPFTNLLLTSWDIQVGILQKKRWGLLFWAIEGS